MGGGQGAVAGSGGEVTIGENAVELDRPRVHDRRVRRRPCGPSEVMAAQTPVSATTTTTERAAQNNLILIVSQPVVPRRPCAPSGQHRHGAGRRSQLRGRQSAHVDHLPHDFAARYPPNTRRQRHWDRIGQGAVDPRHRHPLRAPELLVLPRATSMTLQPRRHRLSAGPRLTEAPGRQRWLRLRRGPDGGPRLLPGFQRVDCQRGTRP